MKGIKMIGEYLENLYQELYEKKIVLEQQTQKKETELDNNIKFIETLKNSLDEDFESFTPRNIDEENYKKIESLMEEQKFIRDEIHRLQLQVIKYNTKIRELDLVMEDFRSKQGYIEVPLESKENFIEEEKEEDTEKNNIFLMKETLISNLMSLNHKVEICNKLMGVDPARCKLELQELKIIVCHLGNGASVSAVKNGRCVDTSMGLTPLEGLIMGTRSGDIDPAIMEFLAHKEGKNIDEIMTVLNKKSGVLGLSNNLSSDFRDLEAGYNAGDENAIRTMKTYCYHVAKYIGSYTAAMNGVDVICFTAGIGENAPLVRTLVCGYLGYLGVTVDQEANHKRGEEIAISTPDSRTTVMVIPTNEELAIARETVRLVG